MADWTTAVQERDRTSHDRVWAAASPGASDQLATSLFGLGLSEFSAVAHRTTLPSASGGPRTVEVQWRLPGDRTQRHLLPVTTSRVGDAAALAPATDHDGDTAVPLWWLQPTTALTSVRSGLLVGGVSDPDEIWAGVPVSDWQHRIERAVTTVSERTRRATGEENRVWFELPGTREIGEQVLGGADLTAVAALAATVGERRDDSAIHVVLDATDLGALNAEGAIVLLTHEAVHVVTRAPHTPLPLWVEEGWAEVVAWSDDEVAGWRQAAPLLERIRAGDDVIAIPTDKTFTSTSGDELTIAYALAWSLCHWMLLEGRRQGAADDGWEALRLWYDQQAPTDGSEAMSEAQSCAAVFQLPARAREERWRDWLIARAGQP